MNKGEEFKKSVKILYHLMMAGLCLFITVGVLMTYYIFDPNFSVFKDHTKTTTLLKEVDEDIIENGIHLRTGFIDAEGLMTVINNCTNCHSAKLVIQNRMSTEHWNATIRWMQETQNLWELGFNQEIIVNYLVINYPVEDIGRRENLTNITWYDLEN